MKITSGQKEFVKEQLNKHSVLRLKDLTDLGVVPSTVSRMVQTGEVKRVARGLYQSGSSGNDQFNKIVKASKMIPKGIICLTSALFLHEILNESPSKIWVAIKKNSWVPKIDQLPIQIIQYSEKYFFNHVEIKVINGTPVKTFSVAKSVVDCFRHRNKLGFEVARKSLESTISRKISYSSEIMDIARSNRAVNILRPYVQMLISNRSI